MELLRSLFTLVLNVLLVAAGQMLGAIPRRSLTTFSRWGGRRWRRGRCSCSSPFSCFCSICFYFSSFRGIWRRGADGWHFSSLGEPGVNFPPCQFSLRPQTAQLFIWRCGVLLKTLLQHHKLLRRLLLKLLQGKVWKRVPRFGTGLLLLHGRCTWRMGWCRGLVAGVDNNGGVSSAATCAPASTTSVVKHDDVAVLGVALVVPGVTEPLFDLPFRQVGKFHQSGNFSICDKVVLQVAGFQLRQLLFGFLRSHAECVNTEGWVLLRDRRKKLYFIYILFLQHSSSWKKHHKVIFVYWL